MAASVRLEDYDIDPVRGFLPGRDPLTALPSPFSAWDQVAAQLPLLVMNGRALGVLGALRVG
jgi:indoleamine 2,3-dioxygenase